MEKTKLENLLYNGKILKLYCDEVLLENGKTSKREYVSHNGGASIVAVDDEDNIYLVEQFRYAYRESILEIPAGKLELNEKPEECARRELKEEIGGECECLELLSIVYPSPGYTNEPLYVYLAKGLKIGENHLDEGEFLNVVKMPFKKALELVMDNTIKDSKTVIGILKYNTIYK